jgi:hypothetical protein
VPPAATATATRREIDYLWSEIDCNVQLTQPAETALLNLVYNDILDNLTLSAEHEKWLADRGLPSDIAWALGYRSSVDCETDYKKRPQNELEKKLLVKWKNVLQTVPGWDGKQDKLLMRRDAIVFPCRNLKGDVVALKQRLLDTKRGRMRLLSSSNSGGPRATNGCHVPIGVGHSVWKELWITEGERKADYNFIIRNLATIAIPGVSTWRRALELIPTLLAPGGSVIIALDQDDAGRNARDNLLAGIRGPYTLKVATWEEDKKGLDDAINIKLKEVERSGTRRADPHYLINSNSELIPFSRLVEWVRNNGPVLRQRVPCYQPHISKLIREGKLQIEYSKEGQVIKTA